jgi:tetratricopeptide (TPR) repeat protein/DNA-binding XRE family transcriptional regulator
MGADQENVSQVRDHEMGTGDTPKAKNSARLSVPRLRQERERRGWTQNEVAERIGSTRVNISRWESGLIVPGPYYRQKLSDLFGKSIQELGFIPENSEEHNEEVFALPDTNPHTSTPTLPVWSVPYRRNPFFTGREEILDHLHTVLRSRKTAALTPAYAISGLGGIGKTQIAIEYAYRYRDHYQAIFWIDASTREALSNHFMALAALLGLSQQHILDQEDIIGRAVQHWLTSHTQWLLILDNIENLEMMASFLPSEVTGDVLLTTRLQALGTVAQSIEVEKMEPDEGSLFLLRRAKVIGPDASLDQAAEESRAKATEIFAALDGLPLALDQAGAYIEETNCGLSKYLNLFATRRKELLLRRGRSPVDHPDSVAATWSLSFQRVERENPAAADLLRLFTFLNPESIPEELITLGAAELGPTLEGVASDPLEVDYLIELLLRYSLLRRNPEVSTLSIHRLVQVVLKDGMDRDLQLVWAERAIRAVNRSFPNVEPETWEKCQRFLPHVQVCAMSVEEYNLAFPEAARLLNEAASYLMTHGSYSQMERLLLRALAIRRQKMGTSHLETARTLNDLGALYQSEGKYQQAELVLQEALTIRQQALGEEHRDVAETLHNLANSYRALGEYAKAEPFYLRALHIREATLGMEHPLVAQSYYGLAKLYNSQEKYQQAAMFCKHALHIQEQRLGDHHPTVASTLNMLAKIYQGQHKLDQAEEMNMRALQIREQASDVDHPHVATILNRLVEIYHAQRRYHEAEVLIARASRIHEQLLGPAHPYTAYSHSNRARNLFLQGKYVQAESYYRKALAIREQNLGVTHPNTASSYADLAELYASLERNEEAESFYRKAISIHEHTFGPDHPTVTRILEQLAILLRKLKKEHEATEVEVRIQATRARQIAHESP